MIIEMLMKDIEYNPTQIQKYAKKMYGKAIIAWVVWPIVGLMIAFCLSPAIGSDRLLGMVIGVVFGMLYASLRSIRYKLKAQCSLCMMQIEINSHNSE